MIRVKRVQDPPEATDGTRILVDRLWPRGLKRESAAFDLWVRDAAPSAELRRWFGHEPGRWPEFRTRYFAELDLRADACGPILEAALRGDVTLLFAARDREHNNATALLEYLSRQRQR